MFDVSTNRRSGETSHGGGLYSSEVEGEVVSISFMHNFHTQVCSVKNISPGVEHTTLTIKDGLVEVETVQVEGHG